MLCSTTYRTLLSFVGSLVLTLGTFGMLRASAWDTSHRQAVGYHTADLASPAGAARVYHRIQAAAERVCSPAPTGLPSVQTAHRECVRQAVVNAVADIDNPQLSAVHSATMSRWRLADAQRVKLKV